MHEVERLRKLVQDQRDRIETLEAEKDRTWALLEDMRGRLEAPKEPVRKGLLRRVIGSVAVLVVLAGISPLRSESGNAWLAASDGFRNGYVVGALDAFSLADGWAPHNFKWMMDCVASEGAEWTYGQLSAVLEKYLYDHPEERHFTSAGRLHNALVDVCS